MNFNELYKKIAQLDNHVDCGEMHGVMVAPTPPQQPDSVTMSVNLNGAGSTGIRDLMNILKNIDDVGEKQGVEVAIDVEPDHDMLVPDDDPVDEFVELRRGFADDTEAPINDSYENSISGAAGVPKIFKTAAVTATGDDLASKGKGALKANGGENPFNVNESLIDNLHRLYHDIKSR